ncbi:MFS transporter [Paraconexibacter algicola]|uniref:MFS transporter n=1 Tax=Paraconexibacter algicola TaxID=2133960 RepID=A0A2T4UK08_9ACTN|nr:MFS transporter [Paraconexibacter algicola]PTL59582.1 MFS transporter [Paraconexibacter algicola]
MTALAAPRMLWGPLAAVCLAQLLLMLDVTIVIVALPVIGADLGASLGGMQWTIDIYALTLAALMLNAGSVADRIGRRRVFLWGLGVFGLASAVCGLAWDPGSLIAARALQGVGGAMLFATGLAILGAQYVGQQRAVALGVFGAVFGAAVALGPLVGGAVIELVSWRWIFLANVPVVIAAAVVALRYVQETRDPEPRPVDWAGQLTFTVGIATLLAALIEGGEWGWASVGVLSLLTVAVASLIAFVWAQRRQSRPMFDLDLVRDRSFAGAAIAAFATSASLFGMFVYLTLWFQRVLGMSGLEAGLRLLPVTIVAFVAAAAAGRFSGRVAPRLVLGTALAATSAGLLQMTMLDASTSWTVAFPGLVLCGLGFGLANPTVASVTLAVAPPRLAATATGMNSTFRQVGVASGVAALGAIFDHALDQDHGDLTGAALRAAIAEDYSAGLDRVFVVSALVAAAGAVLSICLVRVRAAP